MTNSSLMTKEEAGLAEQKKNIVDHVLDKVKALQVNDEIKFPAGYSPENAMKSAWLLLQDVKTGKQSGFKPALEVAEKTSIANALLDMVVQGLNPMKKQGYFLMYGNKLTFQRSYFGTMMITKRVTGCRSIDAVTIHEGDKVDYEIINGRIANLKHVQSFGATDKPILGAYCTIVEKDGSIFIDLMTKERIDKSWAQSKADPTSKDSTHSKFPVEMTKRTVIQHACKIFLNTSDDSSILTTLMHESDERNSDAEIEADIIENSNGDYLDFEEVTEGTPEKPQEAAEEPARQEPDIFTNAPTTEQDDDDAPF